MNRNEKIMKFMKGRYGILDELHKLLMYTIIILVVVNLFIKSYIISTISLILLVYDTYRFLSKKIYERNNENQRYLDFKKRFKKKNYILRKCHYCKCTLKFPLPSKIGIKHSKCPECKKRNTFLILRKK